MEGLGRSQKEFGMVGEGMEPEEILGSTTQDRCPIAPPQISPSASPPTSSRMACHLTSQSL
jgi:hypothetical protein